MNHGVIYKMFHSVFFYLDWLFAILGMTLMIKYAPKLKTTIEKDKHGEFIVWFLLLTIAAGGCLYLTNKMGDEALKEIGMGWAVTK